MILKDFDLPAQKYGEVSFFWWQGDPVTREKLEWILQQLKDKDICGLQINYGHSDHGGMQYGLTMASDPRPLSDRWWELVGWFIKECRKYGMSVSLSDYTLGAPGQGFYVDEVLAEHPEYIGQRLIRKDGTVRIEKVPFTINPMAKGVGDAVIEKFYHQFEVHFPGECGKGINYFFSDELNFNIRGNLWSDDFAEEFRRRKGYDIREKWDAIFDKSLPDASRIRLDYYDVIVRLSEEAYFKPVYEWHEKRGMTFGCDHGGRGKDVTEFGDYFRTMKWYQGPGNDQPRLASDIIKSKVSGSIAHLYRRPRVWLEGFYSSGWQTSAADVADAVFRNFGLGHNLLSLHGLYYSMHGSMWEWAPPCNHYHMPYWTEMGALLRCTKRLSYSLAQGVHRCDAAIVYPVAAMEADPEEGKKSVAAAFEAGEYLYRHGTDFDFIDFESIEQAEITGKRLCVSGEEYRYIILPDMRCVRYGMYRKLEEFSRQGCVIILGSCPDASDYTDKDGEPLEQITQRLKNHAFFCRDAEDVYRTIAGMGVPDIRGLSENTYFMHRIIEGHDLYYLYGTEKGKRVTFRTAGVPVYLDPWSGKRFRIQDYRKEKDGISLCMPLTDREVFPVAFEDETAEVRALPVLPGPCDTEISTDGEWTCNFIPTMDNRFGDYRLPADGIPYIGPECREPEYAFAERLGDIRVWGKEPVSFGTQFFVCHENGSREENYISMESPCAEFRPYSFSMREGIKGDAGYQGSYHGLKEKLSDDFLAFGDKTITMAGSSSEYAGEGTWYAFTTVYSSMQGQKALLDMGEKEPAAVWINHRPVTGGSCLLNRGTNYILLKYEGGGRTHFILRISDSFEQKMPLATKWYRNTDILPFDPYPQLAGRTCWFRFRAPAGASSMKIVCHGSLTAYADGKECPEKEGTYTIPQGDGRSREIILRLVQERSYYGCAAFEQPIAFTFEEGIIRLPVDEKKEGLEFYSGGIHLCKEINDSLTGTVHLKADIRNCAVRVIVNGKTAGTMLTPPYECDITEFVRPEHNRLELYTYNTLHNHMKSIPTNFNCFPGEDQ